jgi:hypothetical protein
MEFKGTYKYYSNPNGDIELIDANNEEFIGYNQPIEFTDNEGGIKFTEKQTPIKFTRKETPIFTGVLNYFPDAIRELARVSYVGNQQHNPDKPMHWDRSKSGDELDALSRHLLEAGTIDTDGIRHSAKVAWRALANLQKEIENETK